jgi:hypothetical protein
MEVALRASPDERDIAFIAASIPYDSVFELVTSLTAISRGDASAIARWNTEPTEYDMELFATNQDAGIAIAQYPDHSRQRMNRQPRLLFRGSRRAVIQPFWRALRGLESNLSYAQLWLHPFPSRDLQQLAQYLTLLP